MERTDTNVLSLSDEVAAKLRNGVAYRVATADVLKRHGVTVSWDWWFSEIGRLLSARRKKTQPQTPRRA